MNKLNKIIKNHNLDFSKENDFRNDNCIKHKYFNIVIHKKDNPFNSIKRYDEINLDTLDEFLSKIKLKEDEYGIISQIVNINHPAIDEEYIELYYFYKSQKEIKNEIDYLIYKYNKSNNKNILKQIKKKILYLEIE